MHTDFWLLIQLEFPLFTQTHTYTELDVVPYADDYSDYN